MPAKKNLVNPSKYEQLAYWSLGNKKSETKLSASE